MQIELEIKMTLRAIHSPPLVHSNGGVDKQAAKKIWRQGVLLSKIRKHDIFRYANHVQVCHLLTTVEKDNLQKNLPRRGGSAATLTRISSIQSVRRQPVPWRRHCRFLSDLHTLCCRRHCTSRLSRSARDNNK